MAHDPITYALVLKAYGHAWSARCETRSMVGHSLRCQNASSHVGIQITLLGDELCIRSDSGIAMLLNWGTNF